MKLGNAENACAENAWVTTIDSPQALLEWGTKAQSILQTNRFCTLATCSEAGLPWASPLLFAYDANLTLYWSSAIAALHSQNLLANQGRATIVIYDSTATTGNVMGLFLTGIALEVPSAQVEPAMQLLFNRLEKRPERSTADYLAPSPRRMYQFFPQSAWITGDRLPIGNQLVDTKVNLDAWLSKRMAI
jgi:nitroimidazol reductase NimA-like FMN-containing flavoprotein (pyridoxamine 5'-phosphate oxidase superfamily)